MNWSLRAARYRWAELLRRIYEVDPLACPRCAAPMRIGAVITDPAVINHELMHRPRRGGHEQVPVHDFVAVPVHGKGEDSRHVVPAV